MKVIKMTEIPKEKADNPIFTGPVTRQSLLPQSKQFGVFQVNFEKGVRNKLHTHDSEQVLIITAGKGIVATETEERVVTVGDVVLFEAGEKHWHGATEDSAFSHVYVSRAGTQTKFPV